MFNKTINKRKCAVCHNYPNKYVPLSSYYDQQTNKYGGKRSKAEFLNRKEYTCPFCYATDRDRLCVAFFRKIFENNQIKKLCLLDIAPSAPIEDYFRNNRPDVIVKTADMFMGGVDYKVDIQNMKEIEDESFDIWICFHVLEHVMDDRKALSELYRILKKDGIGILLVPIDLKSKKIDEDPYCSEEERWRRFGQGDHVRRYSKQGFLERIQENGFKVTEVGKRIMGRDVFKQNAIPKTAVLYIVTKEKSRFLSGIS